MPILGALILLIQFCFVYHVFKTGRPYWWMFVIMAFPVMGCVIYYFVEVFPGSREERSARKTARNLVRALQPDAELKKKADEISVCGSLDNKLALAAECMNHQMYDDAAKLYESCLNGAYAADGAILFGLARAAVEGGDWNRAADAIARLKAHAARTRPAEVQLLEARILEGRGETQAALSAYRAVLPAFVGLEARYRYGRLLMRLGMQDAGLEVMNDVLKHARRFGSSIEEEQRWVDAAREAVAGR